VHGSAPAGRTLPRGGDDAHQPIGAFGVNRVMALIERRMRVPGFIGTVR
jgi:hypothetical protein